MKIKRTIVLTVTLLACSMQTSARDFLQGSVLGQDCKGALGTYKYGNCIGYITGVADSSEYTICAPSGVTPTQMVEIVMNYLAKNPQARHRSAATLVSTALKQAYPCK